MRRGSPIGCQRGLPVPSSAQPRPRRGSACRAKPKVAVLFESAGRTLFFNIVHLRSAKSLMSANCRVVRVTNCASVIRHLKMRFMVASIYRFIAKQQAWRGSGLALFEPRRVPAALLRLAFGSRFSEGSSRAAVAKCEVSCTAPHGKTPYACGAPVPWRFAPLAPTLWGPLAFHGRAEWKQTSSRV